MEILELRKYLQASAMPSETVDAFAKVLDEDGDGVISIDEWRAGWNRFTRGESFARKSEVRSQVALSRRVHQSGACIYTT